MADISVPTRKCCFPPVVDQRTRLLILGSLPGEASLLAGQYYAHPRNRFWDLVGGALGMALRPLSYRDRLELLLAHGIGLWDVIADAERNGSLDSAIRGEASNDLATLSADLPLLAAIAFNGGKAARTGRARLGDAAPYLSLIDLPSSSAAHAGMKLTDKQARWNRIADFCGRAARDQP